MSNTPSLLPCPFCGGINIIHCGHHMYCHACGADGPDADSQHESEARSAWNRRTPQPVVREPQCWCLTCRPMRVDDPESIRMALCPTCGNKRCPKANNHRNQCSNSNEPGQKGSAYEGCGITQKGGS